MTTNLEIQIDNQEDSVVVRLKGSADMTEAETLRDELTEHLCKKEKNVIVDLLELSFISSMGLGSLIYAHQQAQDRRGSLYLVRPQYAVSRVLKTTQLDQLFHICETIEEAMEKIAACSKKG